MCALVIKSIAKNVPKLNDERCPFLLPNFGRFFIYIYAKGEKKHLIIFFPFTVVFIFFFQFRLLVACAPYSLTTSCQHQSQTPITFATLYFSPDARLSYHHFLVILVARASARASRRELKLIFRITKQLPVQLVFIESKLLYWTRMWVSVRKVFLKYTYMYLINKYTYKSIGGVVASLHSITRFRCIYLSQGAQHLVVYSAM